MTSNLLRRANLPCSLVWANANQPARQTLESCVARVFEEAHDAHVTHFHELLVGARDHNGELLGVIGASSGKRGPMFLEAYTRQPIQHLISWHAGRHVPRNQVVEVGNLAVQHAGAAGLLVTRLAEYLHSQGVRWVVLTGTTRVRHILRRLGADLVDLGEASGSALGESLASWGTYYDNDPRVVALELAPFCAGFVHSRPLSERLMKVVARVLRRAFRVAFPGPMVFEHA